jgi:hypothetical protein
MTDEKRKASDVLLELESDIKVLIGIVRSQDLSLKIVSNKLNEVMQIVEKLSAGPPKITVEAVQVPPQTWRYQNQSVPLDSEKQGSNIPFDPERRVPISADNKLPLENSPKGFRRTSRPETFEGDNAYLPKSEPEETHKYPVQLPKAPPGRGPQAEAFVPPEATNKTAPTKTKLAHPALAQNAIPVQQRVVNKSGNSVFLADVEIVSHSSGETVSKTRTNGTGKWQAALPIGGYRVTVRKRESLTKEKIEAVQDVEVDGSVSPLELQVMIIKS